MSFPRSASAAEAGLKTLSDIVRANCGVSFLLLYSSDKQFKLALKVRAEMDFQPYRKALLWLFV